MPLVGGFGCLELVLYGIRELAQQHYEPLISLQSEIYIAILQYMSVIFYHDDQQKKLAEDSLKVKSVQFRISNFFHLEINFQSAQAENRSNITTQILPAETFYNAEE